MRPLDDVSPYNPSLIGGRGWRYVGVGRLFFRGRWLGILDAVHMSVSMGSPPQGTMGTHPVFASSLLRLSTACKRSMIGTYRPVTLPLSNASSKGRSNQGNIQGHLMVRDTLSWHRCKGGAVMVMPADKGVGDEANYMYKTAKEWW